MPRRSSTSSPRSRKVPRNSCRTSSSPAAPTALARSMAWRPPRCAISLETAAMDPRPRPPNPPNQRAARSPAAPPENQGKNRRIKRRRKRTGPLLQSAWLELRSDYSDQHAGRVRIKEQNRVRAHDVVSHVVGDVRVHPLYHRRAASAGGIRRLECRIRHEDQIARKHRAEIVDINLSRDGRESIQRQLPR